MIDYNLRKETAEKRYDELQKIIDDAVAEQHRLQGEHRLIRNILEDREAESKADNATKIEVTQEAQDGSSDSE